MSSNIKKYARFLELVCLLFFGPFLIFSFIMRWFGEPTIPNYGITSCCSLHSTHMHPTLLIRFAAALVDGISLGLLLWGGWCFIRILRNYRLGELFSAKTLALYTKTSRIAFIWAIYNPICYSLLSLVTSINNPVGHRNIAFCISSSDIIHIFVVGLFLVITSLMQEAHKLQQDLDLTV